jgi:hypothetical protein
MRLVEEKLRAERFSMYWYSPATTLQLPPSVRFGFRGTVGIWCSGKRYVPTDENLEEDCERAMCTSTSAAGASITSRRGQVVVKGRLVQHQVFVATPSSRGAMQTTGKSMCSPSTDQTCASRR